METIDASVSLAMIMRMGEPCLFSVSLSTWRHIPQGWHSVFPGMEVIAIDSIGSLQYCDCHVVSRFCSAHVPAGKTTLSWFAALMIFPLESLAAAPTLNPENGAYAREHASRALSTN